MDYTKTKVVLDAINSMLFAAKEASDEETVAVLEKMSVAAADIIYAQAGAELLRELAKKAGADNTIEDDDTMEAAWAQEESDREARRGDANYIYEYADGIDGYN